MTPDEARLLLTDAADYIVADHRPVDGVCPVCRVAVCRADVSARAYLDQASADLRAGTAGVFTA